MVLRSFVKIKPLIRTMDLLKRKSPHEALMDNVKTAYPQTKGIIRRQLQQ